MRYIVQGWGNEDENDIQQIVKELQYANDGHPDEQTKITTNVRYECCPLETTERERGWVSQTSTQK